MVNQRADVAEQLLAGNGIVVQTASLGQCLVRSSSQLGVFYSGTFALHDACCRLIAIAASNLPGVGEKAMRTIA